MNLIQAVVLGLVQGLTEFIPVSSSGHLVIMEHLLGVESAGLTFDVALHIGTLTSLLIFFYKDIWRLLKAIFVKSPDTKLAWLIALGTIPAVVAGAVFQSYAKTAFRSLALVSLTLVVMALFMLVAEHFMLRRAKHTELKELSWPRALLIGVAQALAIIPGVSRSGGTITMGIFSGLNRVSAMRFSFLLAMPVTAGAILKVLLSEDASNLISQNPGIFIAGIVTAAISGLLAIKFLLSFLAKHSLHTFAYYRIALGLIILIYLTLT
jgi:undecaprenyl-diphosphatase